MKRVRRLKKQAGAGTHEDQCLAPDDAVDEVYGCFHALSQSAGCGTSRRLEPVDSRSQAAAVAPETRGRIPCEARRLRPRFARLRVGVSALFWRKGSDPGVHGSCVRTGRSGAGRAARRAQQTAQRSALLLEAVLFQHPRRAEVEVHHRGLQPEQAQLVHHHGANRPTTRVITPLAPMRLAQPVAQFGGMPSLGHALLGADAAAGLARRSRWPGSGAGASTRPARKASPSARVYGYGKRSRRPRTPRRRWRGAAGFQVFIAPVTRSETFTL